MLFWLLMMLFGLGAAMAAMSEQARGAVSAVAQKLEQGRAAAVEAVQSRARARQESKPSRDLKAAARALVRGDEPRNGLNPQIERWLRSLDRYAVASLAAAPVERLAVVLTGQRVQGLPQYIAATWTDLAVARRRLSLPVDRIPLPVGGPIPARPARPAVPDPAARTTRAPRVPARGMRR